MLVNLAPLFQRIPQTFSCFCFPPSNYQAGSMIEFIVRHRWLTYDMTVALLPFYLMSKLLSYCSANKSSLFCTTKYLTADHFNVEILLTACR